MAMIAKREREAGDLAAHKIGAHTIFNDMYPRQTWHKTPFPHCL